MKKMYVVLMVVLAVGLAQAELITNGDFEGGTFVADGVPDGWSAQTGTVSGYDYDRVCNWKSSGGNQYCEAQGWSSGYGDGFSQDIVLTGGETYAYSFRTKVTEAIAPGYSGSGTGYYSMRLYWDNGGYMDIEGIQYESAGWETITGTFEAQAGATGAGLTMFAWGNTASYQHMGQAYDDISIVAVPEPLTMSLLGLGALVLRRRKK